MFYLGGMKSVVEYLKTVNRTFWSRKLQQLRLCRAVDVCASQSPQTGLCRFMTLSNCSITFSCGWPGAGGPHADAPALCVQLTGQRTPSRPCRGRSLIVTCCGGHIPRHASLYCRNEFTEQILTLRVNDKYSKFWCFVNRLYWQKSAPGLKWAVQKFDSNLTIY